jgi:hypothetical protein
MNKTKALSLLYILLFLPVILMAQGNLPANTDITHLNFTVEEAPDWTNLLKRTSGWFGGDGIFTIPLNGVEEKSPGADAKTMFIFSDSMIGQIDKGVLQPGYKMVHNTIGILKGNKPDSSAMKFYWNRDSTAQSIFVPHTPNTVAGDYFWLGDGFVNQEKKAIYVFGYRIHNVSAGAFGFKEVGNVLIKMPVKGQPPFDALKQMDSPLYLDDKGSIGSFGAGIYVNTKEAGAPKPDGYVYVYGVRGLNKGLMVARVLPKNFEDFSQWRFWDGSAWNADIHKVADLTDNVSNELSLSAWPDGRYALVFQVGGMSTTIGLRIGLSPAGPFGPIIKVYDCKGALTGKNYLVYNAKGHPSISQPGELLITYNINALEFDKELQNSPNLYRPRFIRIKFQ